MNIDYEMMYHEMVDILMNTLRVFDTEQKHIYGDIPKLAKELKTQNIELKAQVEILTELVKEQMR